MYLQKLNLLGAAYLDLCPGCSQFPNIMAGEYSGCSAPPTRVEAGPTWRAETALSPHERLAQHARAGGVLC